MSSYYPSRIICLTEETTETLYLLGEQDRIVGISGFTVRPPQARKEKPKVSAFTEADIDQIIALKPDLVIGYSDIQANIAQQLITKGISVWINNYNSIDGIFHMIVQLGALVGKQREAIGLVDEMKRGLDAIAAESIQWKQKPKVYFEEWFDPLICGSLWVSELIGIAGGIDVCADKAKSLLAKGRIIADPNEIVDKNPDIILASWCGKMVKKEKIINRAGWETITAIRNNDIHEIKSPVILQPGPAALTDGVKEMFEVSKKWYHDKEEATRLNISQQSNSNEMQFFTIGVYGSTKEEFYEDLVKHRIDTFCDIRRRRAVRGSQYAFANSEQLQEGLKKHKIQYLHIIDLAPTEEIISLQDSADKKSKTARRKRTSLSKEFTEAYRKEVLNKFSMDAFITQLQWINAQRIVLFCVEESEQACHRGIVAGELEKMGYGVTHL